MSVDQEALPVQSAAGTDETVALLDVLRWAALEAAMTGETVDTVVARQHPELAGRYSWAPRHGSLWP